MGPALGLRSGRRAGVRHKVSWMGCVTPCGSPLYLQNKRVIRVQSVICDAFRGARSLTFRPGYGKVIGQQKRDV